MINFLLDSKMKVYKKASWKEIIRLIDEGGPLFADIQAPDEHDIRSMGAIFGFHPLNLEDCTYFSESPKIEEHKQYIFTVLHSAVFDKEAGACRSSDIHIFLGQNYILTVHNTMVEDMDEALQRILSSGREELRCDFAYYHVLDSLVDNYSPITGLLAERVDSIEEIVFDDSNNDDIAAFMARTRRGIISLKRVIVPQKDILYKVAHTQMRFIDEDARVYIKDVYDHILKAGSELEEQREILANLAEAVYSKNSARLNVVMQRLTIISTLFMPLTFIVGIYGMNFRHMPELEWRYGYYTVLAVMAAAGIGLVMWFKKRKWL